MAPGTRREASQEDSAPALGSITVGLQPSAAPTFSSWSEVRVTATWPLPVWNGHGYGCWMSPVIGPGPSPACKDMVFATVDP